jgi:hypothetical protein
MQELESLQYCWSCFKPSLLFLAYVSSLHYMVTNRFHQPPHQASRHVALCPPLLSLTQLPFQVLLFQFDLHHPQSTSQSLPSSFHSLAFVIHLPQYLASHFLQLPTYVSSQACRVLVATQQCRQKAGWAVIDSHHFAFVSDLAESAMMPISLTHHSNYQYHISSSLSPVATFNFLYPSRFAFASWPKFDVPILWIYLGCTPFCHLVPINCFLVQGINCSSLFLRFRSIFDLLWSHLSAVINHKPNYLLKRFAQGLGLWHLLWCFWPGQTWIKWRVWNRRCFTLSISLGLLHRQVICQRIIGLHWNIGLNLRNFNLIPLLLEPRNWAVHLTWYHMHQDQVLWPCWNTPGHQ